jgi:hypothetical protein
MNYPHWIYLFIIKIINPNKKKSPELRESRRIGLGRLQANGFHGYENEPDPRPEK